MPFVKSSIWKLPDLTMRYCPILILIDYKKDITLVLNEVL